MSPTDPEVVAAALARRWHLQGPLARYPAGSSPVYAVGDHAVLKLFAATDADAATTERRVLAHLDGRLPIATPRLIDATEEGGWHVVAMTQLPGIALSEAWPEVPARDRLRLVREAGAAIAALHALPTDHLDLPGPDWPTFLTEQRRTAHARQVRGDLGAPWLGALEAFLDRHAPAPTDRRALLHTEIMREHLVVAQQGGSWQLTGLLDWEPARIGDPAYETSSIALFVAAGDPRLHAAFWQGYRTPPPAPETVLAWALLHRYSRLRWYLERLGTPPGVTTLEGLARAWFAA